MSKPKRPLYALVMGLSLGITGILIASIAMQKQRPVPVRGIYLTKLAVTSPTKGTKAHKPSPKEQEQAKRAAARNNAFGMRLIKQLMPSRKNLFLSPYSAYSTLSMATLGARGQTQKELQQALDIHKSKHGLRDFKALQNKLTYDQQQDFSYILKSASRAWIDTQYKFQPAFLKWLNQGHRGDFAHLPLSTSPLQSRKKINLWSRRQTQNMIPQALPPGAIGKDTRFLLTNAVLFQSRWNKAFVRSNTKPKPFYPLQGKHYQVPMMARTDHYTIAQTKDAKVLWIGYRWDMSMVILLPNKGVKFDKWAQKALDVSWLQKAQRAAKSQRVALSLPRFKMTSRFNLSGALKHMGVKQAFSPTKANFSGILADGAKAFLSDVHQSSALQIDEKGTKAAAITHIVARSALMRRRPKAPLPFRVNRPFLLMVQDQTTKTILFVGQIQRP